ASSCGQDDGHCREHTTFRVRAAALLRMILAFTLLASSRFLSAGYSSLIRIVDTWQSHPKREGRRRVEARIHRSQLLKRNTSSGRLNICFQRQHPTRPALRTKIELGTKSNSTSCRSIIAEKKHPSRRHGDE